VGKDVAFSERAPPPEVVGVDATDTNAPDCLF
jgi:hypothetical protein